MNDAPHVQTLQGIETLTASSLRTLVRDQFRQPLPPDAEPNDLDRAIQGIRVLSDQIHLARGSSSATTRGVQVEVTADFVGVSAGSESSEPYMVLGHGMQHACGAMP